MRQIEDKWKIDPRDPPNTVEAYKSILESATLTTEHENDVFNYRNFVLKNTVFKKCTQTCLKKDNFNDCFDNCSYKYNSSIDLFNNTADHFYEKYDACQLTGRNYFQT